MAWNRNQESDTSPAPRTPAAGSGSKMSTLGPSISIQGDLTGAEDLRIEGSVEGTIRLDKQSVLVSGSGRITADVYGRSICVEGQVRGNLYGEKEIVIRPSGKLEGNITAPSVTLENGAKFRGSIDMEPTPKRRETPAASPSAKAKKPEASRTERRSHGSSSAAPATAES